MIKSFRDKKTKAIYNRERAKGVSDQLAKKARRKLRVLESATTWGDLNVPPSNRPHALHGDREGQTAIDVDGQWRLCFVFDGGHAHGVELTDYH